MLATKFYIIGFLLFFYSGIGQALTKKLYELGTTIYALSRTSETLEKLQADCPNVKTIQADLGDWKKSKEILSNLNVVFDGIVNNAGVCELDNLLDTTEDNLDRYIQNALYVMQCMKIFAKALTYSGICFSCNVFFFALKKDGLILMNIQYVL